VSEKKATVIRTSRRAGPRRKKPSSTKVNDMKAQYDFSKMKSRRNPYASKLKKSVTMRLPEDVVDHFKSMATEAGVPYQSLINLYLRGCLAQNRNVEIKWPSAA
jgi:predicted DNA binding CopG/RHH family protein